MHLARRADVVVRGGDVELVAGEHRRSLLAGPGEVVAVVVQPHVRVLAGGVRRLGVRRHLAHPAHDTPCHSAYSSVPKPRRRRDRPSAAPNCRRPSSRSAARSTRRPRCSGGSRHRAGRRRRHGAIPCERASMTSRRRGLGLVVPACRRKVQGARVRELRLAAEPAVTGSKPGRWPCSASSSSAGDRLARRRSRRMPCRAPADRLRLRPPPGSRPRAIRVEHAREHRPERRAPVLPLRRKIGAAVEDLAVGREEGGERPAALAGKRLHRALIACVHVGPLVAIDFDADEVLVDERRRSPDLRRTRRPSRGTSGTTPRRCRAGPADPAARAAANASSPHGNQWTGWWAADCR